jgi:hypothetical protein
VGFGASARGIKRSGTYLTKNTHIELLAELPPDVVAAVQARDRARDRDATVAELLAELAG